MEALERARKLEQWYRGNGGYLHPSVGIAYSDEVGYHWQANTHLDAGARITTVPHSLALSYLNALVDDAFPVFRDRRHDFAIENLGFFYLMAQYINRDRSFWKPYLDTLPPPDMQHTTPLWFDDPQDLAWLEGTDVLHTLTGRREVYEQYYQTGIRTLKTAGIDTTLYTWDLYRWSITMFTSRSFSSRVITPQDSKYWTTYKTNAQGRRQTVLLDMSRAPAEDLHFSVLFPVQDAGNHSNDAHVDWAYDPGRFSISISEAVQAGEVFNNYGGKGNDELLMGYGFCIPGNSNDTVMLTLKPPPDDLQANLKRVHSGYFTSEGQWSSDRATFRLRRISTLAEPEDVFRELPEPLLEILLYVLRHERGLPFAFYELPLEHLTKNSSGRRYLPHIARMIVQSLAPKLQKLQSVPPPADGPNNERQRQASIYRAGQLEIMQATIAALRSFTRLLPKPSSVSGPRFVTLEGLLELWSVSADAQNVAPFIAGIEAVSGTADVDHLRQAGWEDDVVVLLLCYIYLGATHYEPSMLEYVGEDEPGADGDPLEWVVEMLPEGFNPADYLNPTAPGEHDSDALAHAEGTMELVAAAANAVDGQRSSWDDSRWSAKLIAELGGKMLQFDSLTMMVPKVDGQGEEARLVMYLHSSVE